MQQDIEKQKENQQIARDKHKIHQQAVCDANKSILEGINVSLKAVLILNSGAALGMLTFASAIFTSQQMEMIDFDKLSRGTYGFAGGAFFAVMALLMGAGVQISYYEFLNSKQCVFDEPYVVDGEKTGSLRKTLIFGSIMIIAAIGLSIFFSLKALN